MVVRQRSRFAVSATILLACLALLANACASQEEEASGPQSNQNTAEGTSEDTNRRPNTRSSTASEKGTQPTKNDAEYATLSDATGALSVDVPVTWTGVLKGTDSEVGSNWSSFGGVSIGSSITATPDLYAWHNTAGAPGLYAVASRSLAQRYSDDELVALGPNDFSSSCAPGARRDYNRPPYSGKMQQWDCGEGHSAFTLAAAPEDRECMVLLQVAMYEEADVEIGQHILDGFKADCGRVVESATQETSREPASTAPHNTPREPETASSCVYSSAYTRDQAASVAATPEEKARILSCPIEPYTPGVPNAVPPDERAASKVEKSEKPELIPTPHGPVPVESASPEYRALWERSKETGEDFPTLVRERYGECFGMSQRQCEAKQGAQQ